ncbi:hypothetical protein FEM48_Zijuj11G0130800 [Ziziphus jujuba var. spinosa]|uniref:Uncharacterized protein n=1 Tax=Ziziphus jujuba var. spinosa TaxID=714518 RepID=A0A978UJ36_ZIZJJ|nr:hypothetical protein FEM48_Zijuj11G0130800 [Ziziphus jujuba var. spinosa]
MVSRKSFIYILFCIIIHSYLVVSDSASLATSIKVTLLTLHKPYFLKRVFLVGILQYREIFRMGKLMISYKGGDPIVLYKAVNSLLLIQVLLC